MNRTLSTRTRLSERVEEYFRLCDAENGEIPNKLTKPYTLSGLLYHLGMSRDELEALTGERKYARIILAAKLKIESHIEENALNGKLSGTAAINSLKCNFGWSDKQDNSCRSFSILLEGDADELGN